MKEVKSRDDFLKLDGEGIRLVLQYQPLTWFNREDFEKLDDDNKRHALQCQSLSWFNREDFEELNSYFKQCALIYQPLSWFDRNDFEQLSSESKWFALKYQQMRWFNKEDFEKLNDCNKQCALQYHPRNLLNDIIKKQKEIWELNKKLQEKNIHLCGIDTNVHLFSLQDLKIFAKLYEKEIKFVPFEAEGYPYRVKGYFHVEEIEIFSIC